MDLMHRKNIEEYSAYLNINKRGTLLGTSFTYETTLSFDILELLYATSFHIVINPYNSSKEIISSIYIIANCHFTILKVW